MNVLLDTCALIWLANGEAALSGPAREAIRTAGLVYVSAVTAWEIGIKTAKGRLKLSESLEAWFAKVLIHHHLAELTMSARSAIRAASLPAIHGDPADRLLIATAMDHNLILLTPDPLIRQYPDLQTQW